MTPERPFWDIDSVAEGKVIEKFLRYRFPELYSALSYALETADPFDIVYPNNPDEYSDVVEEVIVLLDHYNGDVNDLSIDEINNTLLRGIGRRFGEDPDMEKVHHAAELLLARLAR